MSKKQTLVSRRNLSDHQEHRSSRQRSDGSSAELEEQDRQAVQRSLANPAISRPGDILALQRISGNQAVQRFLGLFKSKPVVQKPRMPLSPLGANAVQKGPRERLELLTRLVNGEENINQYTNGICYDTVAFTMYLRGLLIPSELALYSGKDWREVLFPKDECNRWNGFDAIPVGSAIGFERVGDYNPGFFHAAVGVGGTTIRAVNGGLLGAGWNDPVDIRTVLNEKNWVSPGIWKHDGQLTMVWYR